MNHVTVDLTLFTTLHTITTYKCTICNQPLHLFQTNTPVFEEITCCPHCLVTGPNPFPLNLT